MTKKLALRLDDLQVESFTTQGLRAMRGTVAGHESIIDDEPARHEVARPWSGDISCDTCETCNASMCDSCYLRTCGCVATEA
jgi:hypothetical protein